MESTKAFTKKIEKRVRKDIRINKLFKKGDIIYVKDKLSRHFIDQIIGTLPKTFTNDPKKATKIIVKYTLDDGTNAFLEKLLFNKKNLPVKGVKLLKTITDKEALLFAKHNNIKFTPNKKNKKIKEILDKLENLYPQTRFSLSKAVGQIDL